MSKLIWRRRRGPYILTEHKVDAIFTYAHRAIILKMIDVWPKADAKRISKIPLFRFNDDFGQPWCDDNELVPHRVEGIITDLFRPLQEPLLDAQGQPVKYKFESQDEAFLAWMEAAMTVVSAERVLHKNIPGVYWDPFADTSYGIVGVAAAVIAGTAVLSSDYDEVHPVTQELARRMNVEIEVMDVEKP